MMRAQRWTRAAIATALVATAITGCGVWPFNKVFHGVIESGNTVTNTSLGISYVIPKGYYQEKYEATTIKDIALWKQNSRDQTGNSLYIHMQVINWPGVKESTSASSEDAKSLALRWLGSQKDIAAHPPTNVRSSSWDGPNLPGGEYSYEHPFGNRLESCVVAVVGAPGHRVQIEGMYGGRPTFLPEVHDVAISVKAIPNH